MSVKLRIESQFKDKGIKDAKYATDSFGRHAINVMKTVGATIAGIFAFQKISGFFTSSVAAFIEQQKATEQLAATLRANGDDVDALLPKYAAYATKLQRLTAVGDEVTIGNIAMARAMGVTTDKIESAVTAATLFSKRFGIDMQAALKAVTLGFSGNTTQLGKYIPAMRGITDSTVAYKTIMETTNRLAVEQIDLLSTQTTQIALLGAEYDDLKEQIGRGAVVDQGDVSFLRGVVSEWQSLLESIEQSGGIKVFDEENINLLKDRVAYVVALMRSGSFGVAGQVRAQMATDRDARSSAIANPETSGLFSAASGLPATMTADSIAKANEAAAKQIQETLKNARSVGDARLNKPSQSLSVGDLFSIASGQFGSKDPVVSELQKQTDILEEIRDDGVGGLAED